MKTISFFTVIVTIVTVLAAVNVAVADNECRKEDYSCQIGICSMEVQNNPGNRCNDMDISSCGANNTGGNNTGSNGPCACLDKIFSCYQKWDSSPPSNMLEYCDKCKCAICSSGANSIAKGIFIYAMVCIMITIF